jgi:Protein of unknown function (DUF3223)
MASKFVIAGERFASKRAVSDRVRGILHERPLGPVQGQDERFLKAFFRWHPNPDKRAHEISTVRIGRSKPGARCFLLVRHDGTVCDASYKKPLQALTNAPVRKISITQAMRAAIQYQINDFRASHPDPEQAYDTLNFHVDHEYPRTFKRLVEVFLSEQGLEFNDIELASKDFQAGAELPEPLRSRWCVFHLKHARLRLLPREVNSSVGARDPTGVVFGGDAA